MKTDLKKITIPLLASVILLAIVFTALAYSKSRTQHSISVPLVSNQPLLQVQTLGHSASPAPIASSSASPTPVPLTFAQLNALYGPCVSLPVLMYHHIEDLGQAKLEGHAQLSVDPKYFQNDMQFLHDRGYTVVPISSLINFFDHGTPVPKKSIAITFDDAYNDFGTNAAPILKSFGYPATLFVPTGLVENPGYLSWSSVVSLATTQSVLMANHTWSHHNVAGGNKTVITKEITLADTQLQDHGLNVPKVFGYPYGLTSSFAVSLLQQMGYQLAFTTQHGSIQCKQQRLLLPRIRIGNAPLSSYGF